MQKKNTGASNLQLTVLICLSILFLPEKDEDEIIDTAKEQYRVLKTENEFRYGYKVVVYFFCQALISQA